MKALKVFIVFAFVSCSSSRVWVVQQTPKGGTIAYQGDGKKVDKQIERAIHCRPYKMTGVLRKSREVERVYTHYVASSPLTAGYGDSAFSDAPHGSSLLQNSTPMIDRHEEYWKELSYECLNSPE